uniref:Retrovirus-related Pol polyprotein from transposon TNT 1-94 n=1 Tax=Tanacetum cinerariifolium TaxID=118510 RepID=A0A6L2MW77_TANCI|nr:retrovirus-related Pol polyprotein from transposon TNT 1-94 [Tanacetum cinerariifolium]
MIGEPTEGILTRSMDAKLIAASASKCLFADFLSEMKPKKDDKGICIYQEKYTMELLKKYEISNSSLVKTYMVPLNNLGPALAVCWSAKKQQSVAMPLAEAEYVAAAGCCANILWMESQLNYYNIYYNMENSMSPLHVSEKKGKKKKSQIVTQSTPKSQGLETSRAPLRKGKSPRPKDLPCSDHYQMDQRERVDIKDQVDKTQSTRFEMSDPNQNKGKTSSEVEPDTKHFLLTTFGNLKALLDLDDDLKDESDEEMFEAGEEMDEEFLQYDNEETQPPYSTETPTEEPILIKHQSHLPNKDDPVSSRAKKYANSLDASDSESSSFSKTFKPYDNYMPVIERNLGEKAEMTIEEKVPEVANIEKEPEPEMTKDDEATQVEKEHVQEPNTLNRFEYTIIMPTAKSVYEVKHIGSSSRPKSNDTVIDITPPKEHHESPHTTPKPKGIARDSDESPRKLVRASKEAHMEKEERLEKATREARLMLLSKPKLIKVVTEVATEAGVDPKSLRSSKGGHEFLKKQDVKLNIWRFGVTEWDEFGAIIPKKKNKVVKDMMASLIKKYDKLKLIPSELRINPTISSGRKRKAQELETEVRTPRLECNRTLSERVQFINNKVIEYPEHEIFFIDVFSD